MTSHIILTDNTTKSFLNCESHNKIHAYQDLQSVAGKTLSELCKDSENLLVFPNCLNDHKDDVDELSICELSGLPNYDSENKIINVDDVKIKTSNLMGFIGFSGKGHHNTKLKICSRFTSGDKNKDDKDFFLHYMLEKVFKINLFDLNYSFTKSEVFDFLYLLFPYFLKKALSQGVFRSYRVYEKNDSAVRGTINVSRHIRQNPIFNGKVAYRSREYSYDNHITQLIRHTIEFIRTKEIGRAILSRDDEIRQGIKQIEMATASSYSHQGLRKVLHQNTKLINHPYYTHYKNLQKLCLMILNHVNIQYADSSDSVYGILFDGAWLWEEYLATILHDYKLGKDKFEHPNNRTGEGGIHLFTSGAGIRYPDFYKKNGDIVLDAKYKALSYEVKKDDETFEDIKIGFRRDDIHQLVTYMHILQYSKGAFIFPDKYSDSQNENTIRSLPQWRELKGFGGKINVFGLKIPLATDYLSFKSQMKVVESDLLSSLSQ